MAAKGTKRGRGKAAGTPDEARSDEARPDEAAPEASPAATEPEAGEPTSSPEAPVIPDEGPHDGGEAPDEVERQRARAAFEASEPRTAATEGSAARHESWWLAAGLAAVLLVVTVVGLWFFATGDTGRFDSQAQRLDAFSNQVQTQTSRLDAAEQAISALQSEVSQLESSVGELQSTAEALQSTAEANRQSLEQISQTLENLSSDGAGAMAGEAVGELQDTLQSLDARVASLEQGSELDDLTGRVGRLEEEIASLREQEAQRVAEAEAASALGRAYAALTESIEAGQPFAEELEAVTAELPDAPGVETLRPIANEGAPTVLQLQLRLEEIAEGLPQAGPVDGAAEGDGFFETMGERLQGMVTVRRADEADMPGALDRALEALQGGNVEAAIAEIEQVSEAPPDAVEAWLADARARRAAEAGLNELSDAVLRQFADRQ